MLSTTFDIVIVIVMLAGFALFGLAMYGVTLRVGPRNGNWNQPAAMLRRPGRGMFIAMYALAAVHVLIGIGVAIAFPSGGIAVLLVMLATGAFYALCAHSWALAHTIARRHER